MAEFCIDKELSIISDLLFTNKSNIKTADYITLMKHLKNIYEAKQKVIIKKQNL